MAINKNFVIKNGVEVNTNLLVGDSTLSKVGIATTVPGYTLHIGVGAGDRGGIGATDLTVTGVATIGTQNSTSGALNVGGISTFSGDIFVGSGATIQANGNVAFAGIGTIGGDLNVGGNLNAGDFTIDEITARNINVTGFATFSAIGGNLIPDSDGTHSIGAATSEWKDLFIDGTAKIDTLTVDESATVTVDVTVGSGVTLQRHGGVSIAGITTVGGNLLAGGDILPDEDGSRDLGSASKEFQDLFIDGTANIDSLSADTAIIGDLTDNRVVIAGSGGELEDSGNLTFDGTTLAVTGKETVSVDVTVGSGVTIQRHGGVSIAGITTVGGTLQANGDVDLGNATSDTITATGRFDSDLVPSVNDSKNLGTPTHQWRNLNIDGTATLDNAKIGFGTITADLNIAGVTTTGENLGGFKRLVGAASSTVVSIAVTVATKTTDHRYFDQGSDNGYWLDGVESPFVTLVPGKLYYFDQSHSTNSGHPLRFYLEQDKANAYTTEITTGGTPGSSGAYTQIGIGTASNENNHPAVLHYQCSSHALMGNAVATQSNSVNLPDASAAVVRSTLTVSGNILPASDAGSDLGASGTEFNDLFIDGTANIDTLSADTAAIGDLTDNRVVIAGSGGELEDSGNLTFDGTTLAVTGQETVSVDVTVGSGVTLQRHGGVSIAGITTIGGALDVNSTSNFADDVVFAGAGANITFDQSTDDLIFDDNAKAIFGTGLDLEISHNGTNSILKNNTGELEFRGSVVKILGATGSEGSVFNRSGSVELAHNGTQTLFTTGIGITVGLTTLQRNGNAAFAGITTVGDILDVNGRIDGASGANISGISTLANAYIGKLAQTNGTSGSANEVPVADGSGSWNWQPVNTTGAGDITGITVKEEGNVVGTANSITILNFVGNDVTAAADANNATCTVTVDSNIAGINTLHQSYFHDQHITGVVSFISSDQEAVFNVGTAATIYKNGNIRTTGITSIRGGLVVGDTTDKTTNGGVLVATSAGVGVGSIATNGNAAFAGIVTSGGGFNIGIQSAGIVIAKNVGINTLNFVGSGNSITYFAATNTLDVSIAGSSGGGGGVSETETAVSSTSATTVGTFAKASFRSASILAQITQGSNYQVGRYLLIHDGTTVTTIEESAVATGSMLGTFEGVIDGSDVDFNVTMSSSSSATVTTKIDTISIP